MSESTSNASGGSADGSANPEGSRPEGASGADTVTLPREAYESLKKDLGLIKQKNRELESKLLDVTKGEADKGKTLEQKLTERDAQYQRDMTEMRSRYQSIFAENEALKILGGLNLHSTDTAWKLLKEQTEVIESDDGKVILRPKNDYRSLKEFASEWIDKNAPFLKKNERAAGTGETGAGGTSNSGGGAKEVPSDFSSWSRDKQTAWFKENPELGKKYIDGLIGGR